MIERAIKAQGGMAVVSRSGIYQAKIKGTYVELQKDFTGDVYSQPPTHVKSDVDVVFQEAECKRVKFVESIDGDSGWTQEGTVVTPAKDDKLKEMRQAAWMDYAQTLVPLLDFNAFELGSLADFKVGDRPVAEIKATKSGQDEVILSFDKESGLLVKIRQQRINPQTGKVGLHEMFLSDYREVNPPSGDEAVLREAKIDTGVAGLLEFLRKRTLSEEQQTQIQKWIRQLGDSDFDAREQAKKALVAKGTVALGPLNDASKSSDAEVASSAKECLTAIGKGPEPALALAAVRLLASRSPSGVVRVLLDYLPCAADESTASEVRAALDVLGFSDGKPVKELELALKDKAKPVREAAAAIVEAHDMQAARKAGQRLLTPGLKFSMKRLELKDGKKVDEWEITEIVFFNRLENRIFAKP